MTRTRSRHYLGFSVAVLVALGSLTSARGHHETDRIVTGALTVVRANDKKTGKITTQYRVGGTVVVFAGPPSVAPGSLVSVRGRVADGAPTTAPLQAAGSDVTVVAAASPPTAPVGVQRIVAFVVDLQDRKSTATVAGVRSLLFGAAGSLDAYYREASFQKISLAGDVYGPITIPSDSKTGDEWDWADQADAAARAQGIDVSSYPRRIYVLPDLGKSYSGQGTVGGRPSLSWIYDDRAETYAHELGHNLGLEHASTPTAEYGDDSCAMGSPGALVHLNGPHKIELGWIPRSNVQSVVATGTYLVANVEENRPAIQAVEVGTTSAGQHYYATYRRAVGFDATGLSWRYRDRTSVHRHAPGEKTYLLAVLGDGESWSDPTGEITIRQASHDALGASVAVQIGSTAPPVATPTPTPPVTPTPSTPPTPASLRGGRVTADTLNVRETPNGTILGAVPRDFVFVETGNVSGTWTEVTWRGRTAWVGGGYLAGASGTARRITATTLNVRAGPGTDQAVIGSLTKDSLAADAAGSSGDWQAIHFDGRAAFVNRNYTSTTTLAP